MLIRQDSLESTWALLTRFCTLLVMQEEDDVEEPTPARVQDDLFGSDSEDEQDKEEDADEDFAPAPAAPAPTDLKSKLALLAQKKKREAVRGLGILASVL